MQGFDPLGKCESGIRSEIERYLQAANPSKFVFPELTSEMRQCLIRELNGYLFEIPAFVPTDVVNPHVELYSKVISKNLQVEVVYFPDLLQPLDDQNPYVYLSALDPLFTSTARSISQYALDEYRNSPTLEKIRAQLVSEEENVTVQGVNAGPEILFRGVVPLTTYRLYITAANF